MNRAAALLIGQLLVARAFAAESRPFAAPETTELPASGAGSFVQVTIALAIVLAAVFAAAWLMQRLKGFQGGSRGSIKVVSSIALGAKERAVVVQLGQQQLLLGVAPGQVSLLHVLPASLPVEDAGSPRLGAESQTPDFKALLRKSLGLS